MVYRIEDINDPKRAKRILSNHMSSRRSEMKKKLYLKTLEEKVERLAYQAADLTAQVTLLQTDNSSLEFEIKCLKLHADNTKQETEVRDALIKELKSTIIKLNSRIGNSASCNGGGIDLREVFPDSSSLFTEGTKEQKLWYELELQIEQQMSLVQLEEEQPNQLQKKTKTVATFLRETSSIIFSEHISGLTFGSGC